MADMADSLSPLPGLPPEYQTQLQKLLRQRQIAEYFQNQALQQKPTEVVSGYAVRQSPLASIAKALAGGYGAYRTGQIDEQIGGVQSQAAQARQDELRRLVGLSLPQRAALGLTSRDPAVQKMAQTWQEQASKAAEAGGKALIDSGDAKTGLGVLGSGQIPGDYTPPPPRKMETGEIAGNPYGLTYDNKGNPTLKFAPKGIQVNLPGRQAELAFDTAKEDIKGWKLKADTAINLLNSNRTALEALNEGAQAGGGEGFKQAVRKVAQAFGMQDAATAPTDKLAASLGDAVLHEVAKLRPASDKDIQFLQQLKGSINTDPSALVQMLTVANAISFRDLQNFHKYMDEGVGNNLADPTVQNLFKAGKIGYDIPQPFGSQAQKMRMLQELQARGGDVSGFKVGDEPISPDAKFNIGNNALLPPQLANKVPGGNQAPLTPAEQAEYEALRKRFGLQ